MHLILVKLIIIKGTYIECWSNVNTIMNTIKKAKAKVIEYEKRRMFLGRYIFIFMNIDYV